MQFYQERSIVHTGCTACSFPHDTIHIPPVTCSLLLSYFLQICLLFHLYRFYTAVSSIYLLTIDHFICTYSEIISFILGQFCLGYCPCFCSFFNCRCNLRLGSSIIYIISTCSGYSLPGNCSCTGLGRFYCD